MPRNYLIHAYRERDNLVPFECEEEFCTFRYTVKAAIWARTAQFGVDRDLVIKDWSFRRSHGQTAENLEGLGIIYCTTEARQNMVMSHIVSIGPKADMDKDDPDDPEAKDNDMPAKA
jgi:hypothetical protein